MRSDINLLCILERRHRTMHNLMVKYSRIFVLYHREEWGLSMLVSYNGLWKMLIDKNMKKMDLVNEVGISTSTLAKMSKGAPVSMEVLGKICDKLGCYFGDIVHYTKENTRSDIVEEKSRNYGF